jgi:hypothetical protein
MNCFVIVAVVVIILIWFVIVDTKIKQGYDNSLSVGFLEMKKNKSFVND